MKITYEPYKRDFLMYRSYIRYSYVKDGHQYNGTIIGSFDFFTYHIVKFLHGPELFDTITLNRIDKLKEEVGL